VGVINLRWGWGNSILIKQKNVIQSSNNEMKIAEARGEVLCLDSFNVHLEWKATESLYSSSWHTG